MNWPHYNQSLVRRGEILLGFDVINNWDIEIKEMNKDKVGEPFHYPNTFLLLLGTGRHSMFKIRVDFQTVSIGPVTILIPISRLSYIYSLSLHKRYRLP